MKEEQEHYLVGNTMLVFLAVMCTFFSVMSLSYGSFFEGDFSDKVITGGFTVSAILLWLYRINRGWFTWFPRAFSIAVFIGINLVVFFAWIESFDTVVISTSSCPSDCYEHPSMFGPILYFLTLGLTSLNYTLWGDEWQYSSYVHANKGRFSEAHLKFKGILWWFLFVPGFVLGVWVLINNFDSYYFLKTLKGLGFGGLIIAGFFAALFTLIFIFSMPEMRRKNKAKHDYDAMTLSEREDVIQTYKNFVDSGLSCNSYTVLNSKKTTIACDITCSKIGGSPYAENGDDWIESTEESTNFCMQLKLSCPNLSNIWQGRLIVVYVVDWEIRIKSYGEPSLEKAKNISQGRNLMSEHYIGKTQVPFTEKCDEEDEFGYTVEYALSNSKEIKVLLESHTNYPKNLLEYILHDVGYPVLSPIDIILEGGAPSLIQNSHEPICEHCNKEMRFLFEFGEILEDEFFFGDAGMVYIYGCDQHPENCKGFVDSH
ncbi:MAG: hypothetical protein ACRBHB_12330 [Arenicella sp.]